jgi:hypothetical protein
VVGVNSTFFLLLLKLGLIPYAIAVLMPTWRWLMAVTTIVGGALAILWLQDWIVSSDPLHHEGAGGALGRIFALIVTAAFVIGVMIRSLTLMLGMLGVRLRYTATICIAGFAILPALFAGITAWDAWRRRPPSEACANATFRLKVADVAFAIPATSMFNIYLGRISARDAYILDLKPSLREFCGLNDSGKQPVTATHIWLRLRNYALATPAICAGPIPEWAWTYCSAHEAAKRGKEDDVDFPLDIHVFAPDQVNLGQFGGSRSTYEDSLRAGPQPKGHAFIRSDASAPGERQTFNCNPNGSGYWCTTSYPWRDGANLGYAFRSGQDDAAARGARIDAETRKFLAALIQQK